MRVYIVYHSVYLLDVLLYSKTIWATSSEFGTYHLCEQRRFRRDCADAQSRQNLRFSLIQAVSQEEPSDRKPDPWPLWMAGHAQLQFVMTECSKTQIRLMGLILFQDNYSNVSGVRCFRIITVIEPHHQITCHRGLRPVKTQTGLLS